MTPFTVTIQVKYVTVAGQYVKGAKLWGQGTWKEKFAGAGYQQVGTHCGKCSAALL